MEIHSALGHNTDTSLRQEKDRLYTLAIRAHTQHFCDTHTKRRMMVRFYILTTCTNEIFLLATRLFLARLVT